MIGPSHHAFYASLHRRRLWLEHLADGFGRFGTPAWPEARTRLDQSFARTLKRLSTEEHLGIQHRLPLEHILDDRPIESFLTTLSEELDAYECNLLDLMQHHAARPDWVSTLEEISSLWGRELAHEARIALARANAPAAVMPTPETASLKTLAMLFQLVLHGGEFTWNPLLFRRRTDEDLEYELRQCPHRKPVASPESADLACRLESLVCRGFAQALHSDVRYQRHTKPGYCLDELRLGG